MTERRSDRLQAEFIAQIKEANNQITDKQALTLYQVRDAACALLAFRLGERIVIDKPVKDKSR